MLHGQIIVTMDEYTRRRLRTIGLLLALLGLLAMLVPGFTGLALSVLLAVVLILAGLLTGYLTWSSYRRRGLGGVKAAIFLILGLLILFYPQAGTAALGLMLIVYFLMSGTASLFLALELRPLPGWGWTLVNALASIGLAVIFIAGWPFQSHWMVGLLVGVSLFLDGLALWMLSRA